MIASASDSVILHVWQDGELEQCSSFSTESKATFSTMVWCHDNSYIGVVEENGKPLILSSKDRSNLHQVHTVQVVNNATAMAFKHSTKRFLALATEDGVLAIYDTRRRVLSTVLPKLNGPIRVLQYNSTDQQLGVLCEDCLIIFYDVNETDFNDQLKHKSICTAMHFNPVLNNFVAVGCLNGYVTLWDTAVNTKLKQYHKHLNKITDVALTGCGKILLTCGLDYKVCVIDNSLGDCVFRLNLNLPVTALNINAEEKIIATGLNDGSIYLYDIRNYIQPLYKLKAHNTAINVISFENGPRDNFDVDRTEFAGNASSISFNDSESKGDMDSIVSVNHKVALPEQPKSNGVDRVKKDLLKTLRNNMEDLEHQLLEHCQKFQGFFNNEFDAVHESIRDKWDIFSSNDGALLSYCNENRSAGSSISSHRRK